MLANTITIIMHFPILDVGKWYYACSMIHDATMPIAKYITVGRGIRQM